MLIVLIIVLLVLARGPLVVVEAASRVPLCVAEPTSFAAAFARFNFGGGGGAATSTAGTCGSSSTSGIGAGASGIALGFAASAGFALHLC